MRGHPVLAIVSGIAITSAACSLLFPISDDAAEGAREAGATDSGDIDGPGPAGSDGGCTANVRFDPGNCGVCGRSCQEGAACKEGLCEPVRLAALQSLPTAFSLSSAWLTFTTVAAAAYPGNTVSYCPRAGCGATIYAHALLCISPVSLASTAEHILWGEGNGDITRMLHTQLADGGVGRQSVRSDVTTVSEIVLDGTRLYFGQTAASGSIRACDAMDLATCADGGSTLVASNQTNPRSFVVERASHRLFWLSDDRGGAIFSCAGPGACSTPTAVVTDQPNMHALAVDETSVYWTSATMAGSVMRAPSTGLAPGDSPTLLAANQPMPWAIAVDGEFVYFTTLDAEPEKDAASADGTLVRVPRNGGAPIVLAKGLKMPWAIAVDGPLVYWANRGAIAGEGSIEGVAK